ncbi:ABC transporter permease [Clostridium chrysemydis]|uniref:ABC transporter permease n=1 Tax=Clostridium chrysemydis TaxID=2665504 RepID=UPI0018841B07|nr:ABC transporter permease [Clostridium chrysemydis]
MINLLKLEIFKLKKNLSFKIICLAVIFIELVYVYKNGTITGIKAFECSMYDVATMMVVGAIFSSLFIGGEFLNRTINQQIVSGYSRISVFFSKVIITFLATEILMIIYPITSVFINTLTNGFGCDFNSNVLLYIVRVLFLRVIIDFSLISLLIFFAFLFKDTLKTIGVSILTFLIGTGCLFTLSKSNEFINLIYKLTANSQSRLIISADISVDNIIFLLLSNLIIMFILIYISYIQFRRYDLK